MGREREEAQRALQEQEQALKERAETARREKAVDTLLAGQDFPLPESAVLSVAWGSSCSCGTSSC